MLQRPIDQVTFADIEALVDRGASEGRRLEFKQDHYPRTDEGRREFAADVSSFANAAGGDLVIGVSEKKGTAVAAGGIAASDPDQLILAVTSSLTNSIEPPIAELRVVWIPKGAGVGALVIRVPRSWEAPHRVTVGKDARFFVRDENGKHPMNVAELRRAFLLASDVAERVRQFRGERLRMLEAGEGPLATAPDVPQLVLHFVPLSAMVDPVSIVLDRNRPGLAPLGASGWNDMYSLDGLVTYAGPEEKFEVVRAFTTFFRTGTIEAVATIAANVVNGEHLINLDGIGEAVARCLRRATDEYDYYGVVAPIFVLLSLTGVRGYSASVAQWYSGLRYPHRSDRVLLPELRLEAQQLGGHAEGALKPLNDLLWNAFGHSAPRS